VANAAAAAVEIVSVVDEDTGLSTAELGPNLFPSDFFEPRQPFPSLVVPARGALSRECCLASSDDAFFAFHKQ
jgi:hypothetical protein